MIIELEVSEGVDIEPSPTYNGKFVEVARCFDCKLTGWENDLWTLRPCPECGGIVYPLGAGIYKDGKWLLRQKKHKGG